MKTIGLLLILFLAGCATVPQPPSGLDQYNRIMSGSLKADGVNKEWNDYYAAEKEYQERVKRSVIGPILVGVIMTTVAAASTPVPCRPYYTGGRLYPGKAIVIINPIGGGSYRSVIKHYK